jgi:hypothetical protein
MGKQVKLRWSTKENDWIAKYPDNAGKSLVGILFDMLKTEGHRINWEEDLKTILQDRGYDYKTFTITVKKMEAYQ